MIMRIEGGISRRLRSSFKVAMIPFGCSGCVIELLSFYLKLTKLLLLQEFYIPVQSSSIHFLKTRLCVGCTNGFEIVDLDTLDTQGLLDPADPSLSFARKKEELRPMAIYRIDNEFLLCYDGKR